MLMKLPQHSRPIRMRSTATLIGLFAAVMGSINALAAVARGETHLGAISAGVAEVIAITAVLLLVVCPGLWIYNYRRSQRGG